MGNGSHKSDYVIGLKHREKSYLWHSTYIISVKGQFMEFWRHTSVDVFKQNCWTDPLSIQKYLYINTELLFVMIKWFFD